MDESAPAHTPSETAGSDRPRAPLFGLARRILLLTVAFVMLAEIAVYVPSIANFRNNWLRDRLSAAYTAALVLEAAPPDMTPEALKRQLLDSVGAMTIALKTPQSRRLLAVSDMPPMVEDHYDLRGATPAQAIAAAFRTLFAPADRIIGVVGAAPRGGDFIEITMHERPLHDAMLTYSVNILLLSLMISLIVAALAVAAIHWMVLRPVRRLTSSLMAFEQDPEDVSRVITPSGHRDEIGVAEHALAQMQSALARELREKKHLAALGLAVAKINHDLRNMLSSAQLLSDRLATLSDPVARRLAPKLVGTLDRAIAFCQSTLVYGRAVEPPPQRRHVALRPLLVEAAEIVSPRGLGKTPIVIDAPKDLHAQIDPDQIIRVLINLARNAVEALESAGPEPGLQAKVRMSARAQDEAIEIEVADTGPGVPAQARARLFEAFHGSTRAGGTGLGLAIAAEIVRGHGGAIALLDEPGEPGARFRITLPQPRVSAVA